MNNIRTAALAFAAVLGMGAASLAHAQATRTWVSGVGDDVNPCSRTAPCKTFAGAISRTAEGGEINVLDPGGYGSVNINKSITIDGTPGPNTSGIVHSFTYGVNINAGVDDIVKIRGLSINGLASGTYGVRIIQAGAVHIDNVEVYNQGGQGIYDQRTTGGELVIENSVVRNNAQTGIVILPLTGSTRIDATIRNVRSLGNGNSGLAVGAGVRLALSDSVLSQNTNFGLYVEQPAGTTQVNVADSTLSSNSTGILIGSGAPSLQLSNVTITNNATGINPNFVTIRSFGNNKIGNNAAGNGPFSPPLSVVGQQ